MSEWTNRKANARATCDEDEGPAHLRREKLNVVGSPPKKRFFNDPKTRGIDRFLRHTRTCAMNEIHIGDEEIRVQDPEVDAEKSLVDISPFY